MEPIAELGRNYQQLAVVEKWDKAVHYLYPIAQSVPRKHGVARELTLSRWRVAPISAGIDFLGYRLWPTHKLLRKRSVTRAKRTIAHCLAHGEPHRLARSLPSWLGHARWADAHHLLTWLETRHALVLTAR